MKSPPRLVLASTSRYRGELLNRLGIPFSAIAPGVDETRLPGESARTLAIRLARAKAAAVARDLPDAWVIGSDQVALLRHPEGEENALGKPGSFERCIEQLEHCAGRTVEFLTAVALTRDTDAATHEFLDVTRVVYRSLDRGAIERYVAREQPLDCAGAFKSEALGIALCERIETSDPTGLIGLPLIELSALLRRVGYRVP